MLTTTKVHRLPSCTCRALQVVHSDLKALNILLTRGWEVAKIGDVGVARFMHAKDGSGEVAMGTFAYAAPETLLGIDSGVKVGRPLVSGLVAP